MEGDGEPPVAVIVEDDGIDDEDDDGVEWLQLERRNGALRGRNAENISPLLFEMVKAGCTCTSVLSGWMQEEGCNKTVAQCTETPDQAFYSSPHSGRTPLHEACLRNACTHVVTALLNANPIGAMERDHSGNYPLHLLFVAYGFVSVEEMDNIVGQILAVNPSHMAVAVNGDGSTPLHMACSAPETMIDPSILVRILSANPACATTLNNRFQTPLSLYCKQAQASSSVARVLLDAQPETIHQVDHDGFTPLHDAASNLNDELVCFLLERNPDLARQRNREGRTPLHLMCLAHPRERHLDALQALIRAAPEAVSMGDNVAQRTPLHIACKSQRFGLNTVKLLLQSNASAASVTDADNYTALHHACENGADIEAIRSLLSFFRMAAWVVTRKQDTPLHIACGANSSSDTVRLLIDVNQDALTMTNDYGFAPLHCVCRAYQPRMGIVKALLEANPACVGLRTHGGETPIHLACSSGAFVGVLQLLTLAQSGVAGKSVQKTTQPSLSVAEGTTNKVGNTPLHEACFRGASFEHIETLAKATPEWIVVRNNAGYTPLQVMCKGGVLDERVVKVFSRIRGPEVFSVMDTTGHTPLHSACREGTSAAAIRSLIRAFPDALHLKTSYGDTPLHLACFRRAETAVVREIAEASCDGRPSALLEPNTAGQTPIGIAMEEFQGLCGKARNGFCCVTSHYMTTQSRAFEVLATLVKLHYYGAKNKDDRQTSLVKACVCLHRQDVRLDPAFIRRAIHLHPEEARLADEEGNYPLHIEASIPVEKMSLLDSSSKGCCNGVCHSRLGVLGTLLNTYPEATRVRNAADEFPLGLMIQNGRQWDQTFSLALRNFPPALHWYKRMDDKFAAVILTKVSKECGVDTLYDLINSRPDLVRRR